MCHLCTKVVMCARSRYQGQLQVITSCQCMYLTHWGWDKMAAFSQTTLSNTFFLNENVRISIKISLKLVPEGLINNISALVLIMAWRRPGEKPLSEPMMVRSLTHICVTRPPWVKSKREMWHSPCGLLSWCYIYHLRTRTSHTRCRCCSFSGMKDWSHNFPCVTAFFK